MPSRKVIAIVAGVIVISLVLLIVVLWAAGVFSSDTSTDTGASTGGSYSSGTNSGSGSSSGASTGGNTSSGNSLSGYTVYPDMDANGNDIRNASEATSLADLKRICDAESRCLGFNYPGKWMKFNVSARGAYPGSTLYVKS